MHNSSIGIKCDCYACSGRYAKPSNFDYDISYIFNKDLFKEKVSIPMDKSKLKKFYVGKSEVIESRDSNSWGKNTLAEAIEHAKALTQKSGEPSYIVKVIKVVRKKEQPLVIENLK